jgi:PAS domain S-box-containing protein
MSIHQADFIASEELRRRLESAEEITRAIRENEIDALVVGLDGGQRVHPLRGADEAYRVFVEAMGEGAVNVSLDGTILYCNRRFAELLDVPLEQVLGSSIFRFVDQDAEGTFRAFVWEGGHAREAVRRDFRLITPGGRALPVLVTATPFGAAESVQSVCLLVTDLSEHAARVAAEAASRAKDHFLAALSHELRTPLTPALMLVGAALARNDLPTDVREDLVIVRQNLDIEARLIDDLLDLSRVISGKMSLRTVPARAHELIGQAIGMCNGDCAPKRLTIERRLDAARDDVVVDHARLLQALWNLLKNAVKFSPHGGTITVRSYNAEAAWIVQVQDQGIGVSPEMLPRLFTAFEQGDPDVARRYGGMGLGLAITKAVVELHGGSITAHSEGVGRGAVFTISIPLAPRQPG